MRYSRLRVIAGAFAAIVSTSAGASVGHAHSAIVPQFTVVVHFTGLVDVVSDGSGDPEKLWIVLPDVTDLAKLKLSSALKGDDPNWTVAKHQPMLFGSGLTDRSVRCGADVLTESLKIYGYEITFEGDFLENDLSVDRSKLPGPVPCNPSDATCPETRPLPAQERTLNWLPKLDEILMYRPPLRDGLLSDGAGVLAATFAFDRGRVFSSGLWRKEGGYSTVAFDGVPGWRWQRRGTAAGVTVVMQVAGAAVKVNRRSLMSGATTSVVLQSGGKSVVELLVENEPLGDQIPENGTSRMCKGEANDFTAHYVLRRESEELKGPLMVAYDPDPSMNPQCSPADNTWP